VPAPSGNAAAGAARSGRGGRRHLVRAAPPAGQAVEEWKADATSSDWQEIKKPEAPVLAESPAADWAR